MKPTDTHDLVTACLDGTLDARQEDELAAWLRAEPANMRYFVDEMLFDQQMREAVRTVELSKATHAFGEPQDDVGGKPTPSANRSPWRSPFGRGWLAIAACMALLLTGMWLSRQHPSRTQETHVAQITALRGAVPSRDVIWRKGERLEPGPIGLAAGVIELTLKNGVRVMFEGPGELDLLSPMRAMLYSGQAVVLVNKAGRGFQLDTASARVIDYGTEFGVKCESEGNTEVLVFQGEITAAAVPEMSAFPQRLITGDARSFEPGSSQSSVATYRPERFVRALPPSKANEEEEVGFPFNESAISSVDVFPTSGLTIDGDLSDWSAEGLFREEKGPGYFIEGRLRYDSSFLYVAAHIGDPHPFRNLIDPSTDGEFGWRGGGVQLRLSSDPGVGWPVEANAPAYYRTRRLQPDAGHLANATSKRLAHLTLWHHAPSNQDCLHVFYGMNFKGGLTNPSGYKAAFRKDEDGRGYTLEYAIPWALLNAPQAPRPGETLAISMTVSWSEEGGRLWAGQWVTLRNPAEPLRIHTWESAATWGRAVFK